MGGNSRVPSGPLKKKKALVYAHILKGQQLLKVKTFVWIGANVTSEKAKEQQCNSAACKRIIEEMIQGRQKKREVGFFFL